MLKLIPRPVVRPVHRRRRRLARRHRGPVVVRDRCASGSGCLFSRCSHVCRAVGGIVARRPNLLGGIGVCALWVCALLLIHARLLVRAGWVGERGLRRHGLLVCEVDRTAWHNVNSLPRPVPTVSLDAGTNKQSEVHDAENGMLARPDGSGGKLQKPTRANRRRQALWP